MQLRAGNKLLAPELVIPPADDPFLSSGSAYTDYMTATKEARTEIDPLLDDEPVLLSLNRQQRYYRGLTSDAIAKDRVRAMKQSGVDPIFTGHSPRKMAAMNAQRMGWDDAAICHYARWSEYRTFAKHYGGKPRRMNVLNNAPSAPSAAMRVPAPRASSSTTAPSVPKKLERPSSLSEASALVGTKLRKLFGTVWYDGSVVGVAKAGAKKRKRDNGMVRLWYNVRYSDGDEAEFDWEELVAAHKNFVSR